jgi:hypothetical protein
MPYDPPPAGKSWRQTWLIPVVLLLVTLAIAAALIPDALATRDASRMWIVLLLGGVLTGVTALEAWNTRHVEEDDLRPVLLP